MLTPRRMTFTREPTEDLTDGNAGTFNGGEERSIGGFMTLGSLFDGISVFPLAGALCGITPVWASEIDPDAAAVTKARFPEMQQLGDIRRIDGADIPPVDIVTGGSPCQDLSMAGARAGLSGERSSLFHEMIRVIREMREATGQPRFVIWENVAGALNSSKGEDFETVIKSISAVSGVEIPPSRPETWANAGAVVADGFRLVWRVLDARYWGVPQSRTRVFVVADYGSERGPEQPQAPNAWSAQRNPDADGTEADAWAGWIDGGAEEADYIDNPEYWIGDGVPWRLMRRAAEYGDVPPVSVAIPHQTNFWNDQETQAYTSTKSYYQAVYRLDIVGALTACDYKDPPVIAQRQPDGEWGRARRLSPRECLRLQGLPQTWCDVEPALPERAVYRMAGNSIALPCAEFILRALKEGICSCSR